MWDRQARDYSCGQVLRPTEGVCAVVILRPSAWWRLTGPHVWRRYCYVEFADAECATAALSFNETLFKGRQMRVTPKRTNVPGMSRSGFGGRRRRSYGRRGRYGGPMRARYRCVGVTAATHLHLPPLTPAPIGTARRTSDPTRRLHTVLHPSHGVPALVRGCRNVR